MEHSQDTQPTMDDQSKKKKIIAAILVLLLLLAGGLWYFYHQNKKSTPKYDGHAYSDPVKKGKSWTTGDLVVPGFGEVPVDHSAKAIKITLGNSKLNKAYFKYKVQVKQKNKKITLENSKLIKPGNAITEIPTKGLTMKPGKYPMTITIHTYSLKDSRAPLNGSVVDATLVIN